MKNPVRLILVTVFAVVVFWFGCALAVWSAFGSMELRGMAGDMFGASNSLFSALAFSAIVISILYQHHTLKVDRDDFKQTLEEAKRSAEAAKDQAQALNRQYELDILKKEIELVTYTAQKISDALKISPTAPGQSLYQKVTVSGMAGSKNLDDAALELQVRYDHIKSLLEEVRSLKKAQQVGVDNPDTRAAK